MEASETAPWKGIGPGTFEFWWARHGSYDGFVRDAHSLYLENLAELGIVGLLLIGGFVLAVLGIGAVRSLRAPPEQRLVLAAATAGAAGFAMAAALDWVWQLAALAVAFMLLAAVAVSGYSLPRTDAAAPAQQPAQRRNRLQRAGVAAVAVAALFAIWFPLRGATPSGRARSTPRTATSPPPSSRPTTPPTRSPTRPRPASRRRWSSSGRASSAKPPRHAAAATDKEGADWRTWLILARIEAERGRVGGVDPLAASGPRRLSQIRVAEAVTGQAGRVAHPKRRTECRSTPRCQLQSPLTGTAQMRSPRGIVWRPV